MYKVIYLFLAIVACVEFTVSFHFKNIRSLVSPMMLKMGKIDILARDFDLTEALSERINTKVGKVMEKLGHDALSTNVVLKILKYSPTEHHSQTIKKDTSIAEATISFRGGAVLVASQRTDDMYVSIDLLAHKVAQGLKKHNQKLRDKRKKENLSMKDAMFTDDADFNEEELLAELDAKYRAPKPVVAKSELLSLMKSKAFPMPPISIEDAVQALDVYVGHPFYVFRNKDTNEINVVYRRDEGGVGLIMPEKN